MGLDNIKERVHLFRKSNRHDSLQFRDRGLLGRGAPGQVNPVWAPPADSTYIRVATRKAAAACGVPHAVGGGGPLR